MDDFVSQIGAALGIDPTVMAVLIPVIILVFNVIGRLIPDDATGILAVVRKISKVLGLYLSNRVASGVSVNDAARVVAGIPEEEPMELQNRQKVFPGYGNTQIGRDKNGRFTKIQSSWLATLLSFAAVILCFGLLSGCATIGTGIAKAGTYVCAHRAEVELAAQVAMTQAWQLNDDSDRQLALTAAQATLDAIAACPIPSDSLEG